LSYFFESSSVSALDCVAMELDTGLLICTGFVNNRLKKSGHHAYGIVKPKSKLCEKNVKSVNQFDTENTSVRRCCADLHLPALMLADAFDQ
jgi:hypothetical protein